MTGLTMGSIAWGHALEAPRKEFVVPRTLADAVVIPNLIGVSREEIKNDLDSLHDLTEASFKILAQFSDVDHRVGLAMNKIASISNKVLTLKKKYQ